MLFERMEIVSEISCRCSLDSCAERFLLKLSRASIIYSVSAAMTPKRRELTYSSSNAESLCSPQDWTFFRKVLFHLIDDCLCGCKASYYVSDELAQRRM